MGSGSSDSGNSKSSSKAAAETVGICICSSSTTLTPANTKQQSVEQTAEQRLFYLLQKQLKQISKIERTKINAKTKIVKGTPNDFKEEKEEHDSEAIIIRQRANVNKKKHNNNKRSCSKQQIKFYILLNLSSNLVVIAVDVFVLLLLLICHTFVKVVTWHGNILANSSRKRVNKGLNKNNHMNMYDMTTVIGNNANGNSNRRSNKKHNHASSITSSYYKNTNNSNSNNHNNNNNTNHFSTNTSRAIISVATTIASTSASMALAHIPTSLLPPSFSTAVGSDISISMTTESYDNNWSFDSSSSWPTMHQSSNDKVVNLIEMDLANETLSTAYPALRRYYGDYDVSYIARVNPFWLQFDPPSTRTYYIMAIVYAIISSIGCLGNSLVIYMFLRCKSLRTPANTLVINLAVSDLLMLLKCPIAIYNNFKEGPALGDVACRIYGFVGGLSGTASIGTLTAIALDRYNVVVHPLDPLRKTVGVRSTYIISMIWMYSFAFSIVPALDVGLSVYVPEGFLTTCSFDYLDKSLGARIFMFSFFVAAWCVPFTIICFSYFYILKVVFAANRIQSSKDKNKTEQKLALIVVGIIGLWFLAWTPYSIVAMMGVFGKEEYLTPLGSMIPALFCKTAACVDPYFYAATHPRFRMEFRRFFWGRGNFRRSSTTRSSCLTRSSTRRLRVIGDVDMRNRSNDNTKKNNNLQALQEVTEENDDDYEFSIDEHLSDDIIEQSRF